MKNKHLYLVSGKKGSGKSYFSNMMKKELEEMGYIVKVYSFGKRVKDYANLVFEAGDIDINSGDKELIRPIYQAIGMVFRNVKGLDYWKSIIEDEIREDFKNDLVDIALIDDVRFENEMSILQDVKELDKTKVKINRTSIYEVGDDDETETGLDSYDDYDVIIEDNDDRDYSYFAKVVDIEK